MTVFAGSDQPRFIFLFVAVTRAFVASMADRVLVTRDFVFVGVLALLGLAKIRDFLFATFLGLGVFVEALFGRGEALLVFGLPRFAGAFL